MVDGYRLVNPEVAKATYYRETAAAETGLLRELCQYRSFRPENLWVQPELRVEWEKV